MNIKNLFFLIVMLLFSTGCYGTLKGKVVDAETGQPIEGAVAMVEWTKTKGLGNTYTVSAKVVEVVSDREGNIELPGCYSPFVSKPHLTIYKKGYVAWNNDIIFPDYKKRVGFEWKSGQIFRLERFEEAYSHDGHVSFLRSSIKSSQAFKRKKSIFDAFEWERTLAREEIKQKKLSQ